MTNTFYSKVVSFLGSKKFFYVIIAFFVLETVWIALSGRYPMAFDEDYHLGIIQLYTHQFSPFFAREPAGANVYGAVTRDPSYLYHWLMSYPYRWIHYFTSDFTIMVILLRFISVAFFAAGLVVYRRVLSCSKLSPSLINCVFLFMVLTPNVPLVAAQINYDSLLILLTATNLLFSLKFLTAFKKGGTLKLGTLAFVVSLSLLTCLEMYAFLPICAVILIYFFILLYKDRKSNVKQFNKKIAQAYHKLSFRTRISLGLFLALSLGLFIAMYGYNTVKYDWPLPECNQVIGAQACKAYSVWERDNNYYLTKSNHYNKSPLYFSGKWLGSYYYSLFFAINGKDSGFALGPALPIPYYSGIIVASIGGILIICYRRRIFKDNPVYLFLGIVVAAYVLALWSLNYKDYVHLGTAIALQGRYLVVVMPLIYLVTATAFKFLLDKRHMLKPWIVILFVLLFSQGGGAITFIMRSDPSWYWENNTFIDKSNQRVQNIVKHVVYKGKKHST
jgi:hypothetical protein